MSIIKSGPLNPMDWRTEVTPRTVSSVPDIILFAAAVELRLKGVDADSFRDARRSIERRVSTILRTVGWRR